VALLAALLLAAMTVLPACGPKVPPPPPEFESRNRAPTGDNRIEERIIKGIRLQQVSDKDLLRLQRAAEGGVATSIQLAEYVTILVSQGELSAALNLLHRRSIDALGDESKAADSLGLAMGQRRWGACAQMASDYLARKHIGGLFLVRGLCRSRSDGATAARGDYREASAMLALDDRVLDRIEQLTEKRASPGRIAPASEKTYGRLMGAMMQRGILDRLFVQHLLGRFESSLSIGSLDLGSLSSNEIRLVVLSRARSYRQCYAMSRAVRPWRPALRGSVTMDFLIDALGKVTDVTIAEDGWGGHHARGHMNDCVTEQMEALRFPMPRYAMARRAQHRFAFSD
jgi:hypothetical protein